MQNVKFVAVGVTRVFCFGTAVGEHTLFSPPNTLNPIKCMAPLVKKLFLISGSPMHHDTVEELVKKACQEAEVYRSAGVVSKDQSPEKLVKKIT